MGRPSNLVLMDRMIFNCPGCGNLRLPDKYMRADHACFNKKEQK